MYETSPWLCNKALGMFCYMEKIKKSAKADACSRNTGGIFLTDTKERKQT